MYYFDTFSYNDLRLISKRVNIRNLSRITKRATMIIKLTRHFAVTKIQRWTRKLMAYNDICPISFELVRYPCWGFKNGIKRNYYNFPTITDYFSTRGDFRDPISRDIVTEKHIKELADIQKAYSHLSSTDITAVFESRQRFEIENEIDEQIEILEDNFRSVVVEIRDDLGSLANYVGEEDLDVNVFLSPKLYDLKICSGILSNLCPDTHQISIDWAIRTLEETPVVDEAGDIKKYIIEFIFREADGESYE